MSFEYSFKKGLNSGKSVTVVTDYSEVSLPELQNLADRAVSIWYGSTYKEAEDLPTRISVRQFLDRERKSGLAANQELKAKLSEKDRELARLRAEMAQLMELVKKNNK